MNETGERGDGFVTARSCCTCCCSGRCGVGPAGERTLIRRV